jgi:flagellar basal body-associated protein FliL
MSNQAAQPAPEASAPKAASSGRSMGMKLKIAGFILGVVAVEWVVAYLYLPSAAPAATTAAPAADHEDHHEAEPADAGKSHESSGHHGSGHDSAPKSTSRGVQQEVDLGEFTVTAYQPVSSSTLFISFHLYGSALDKHGDELAKRLDDHKHQVRDNIIVIIRSAEITDLTDAGLGLIKRRILETTNRTLGKPLLQGIMFSDFSFVEQ